MSLLYFAIVRVLYRIFLHMSRSRSLALLGLMRHDFWSPVDSSDMLSASGQVFSEVGVVNVLYVADLVVSLMDSLLSSVVAPRRSQRLRP